MMRPLGLVLLLGILSGICAARPPSSGMPGIIGVDDREMVDARRFPWTAIGRLNGTPGGARGCRLGPLGAAPAG